MDSYSLMNKYLKLYTVMQMSPVTLDLVMHPTLPLKDRERALN